MALLRQPPPPPLTADPAFNRWLHDLTAFISQSGGIDPTTIAGLSTLTTTVSNHTSQIASLQTSVNTLNSEMTTANNNITTLQGQMTTANNNIATLTARGYVTHGSGAPGSLAQGVLYINDSGGAGSRLYANVGGAVVALA